MVSYIFSRKFIYNLVQTSYLFLLLFCGCVQHGWMLVSHALAYVTASKNGVSEPEIEDFISLDDKVGF
jgi:hypothetical protein